MQILILLGTLVIPTGAFMLMDLAQRQLVKQQAPVFVRHADRRTGGRDEIPFLD